MNEQQNTVLIQKIYAAFARGDIQTILDNLTSDVEWTLEGPAIIPFAGKRNGRRRSENSSMLSPAHRTT